MSDPTDPWVARVPEVDYPCDHIYDCECLPRAIAAHARAEVARALREAATDIRTTPVLYHGSALGIVNWLKTRAHAVEDGHE